MKTLVAIGWMAFTLTACVGQILEVEGDGSVPGDARVATDGSRGNAVDGAVTPYDGTPGRDASTSLESGTAPTDPGTPAVEAGTPTDPGTPVDPGTPTDPGTPAADSGTTEPPPPPPPPPPPVTPPRFTAVFSTRNAGNGPDTAIEDAIVDLINRAVPGSTIRIAIYRFTRGRVSSALATAAGRGVDVRIVLDGGAPDVAGSEVPALVAGLGALHVTVCTAPGTACIGSGIMHHKTFLFSRLDDGSTDVVMQASHNLTTHQLSLHNNAVIIRGDTALYASYLATWNDLRSDLEHPNYYRIDDGSSGTRVYFYPRTTGDTSVSFFDNVTCDSTSRIRVLMAFFTDARIAVAQALAARAREGCNVQVVVGNAEIPVGDSVLSTLRSAGVTVILYPERSGGWTVHSKYVLIDAPYAGSTAHRRLVFTGSHNWTGPSLDANDETQLRIDDAGVFDAFMADWGRARVAATVP